jgi:PAS domain S-box-containing protein
MSKAKVLIVEDERIIAKDIESGLTGLGYDVVGFAQDSIDAISKVKSLRPDIVLMDVHIEGNIDGIETARIINSTYFTPVVFLTAYADEQTIDRAKEVGPFAYLIKPFNEGELRAAIELTMHRAKEEWRLRRESRLLYEFVKQHNQNKDLPLKAALNAISAKLSLFSASGYPCLLVTTQGMVLDANTAAASFFQNMPLIGENLFSLVQANQDAAAMYHDITGKGSWSGMVSPIHSEGLFQMTVKQVDDREAAKNLLVTLESEMVLEGGNSASEQEDLFHRLRVLTGHLDNVVIYESGSGRDYVSENVTRMFGYSIEDFKDHSFFWTLIHPDDYDKIYNSSYEWYYSTTEQTWTSTYRMKRSDGHYMWVQDQMFQVHNSVGVKYKIGLLINIDDLVQKEQLLLDRERQLEKSLSDKDTLIQEIHHRVRNNLQIIASLLKLQTSFVSEEQVKQLINDSLNRVRTLALIHENLYGSDEISHLDFSEYIHSLVNQLQRNSRLDMNKFRVEFDLDKTLLPVDIATPCGLIINELVTNSFKHAFSGKESGTIKVKFRYSSGDYMQIQVADDGIGMPPDFSVSSNSSLGMMIFHSLCEQVKAFVKTDFSNGVKFELVIPVTQRTQSATYGNN